MGSSKSGRPSARRISTSGHVVYSSPKQRREVEHQGRLATKFEVKQHPFDSEKIVAKATTNGEETYMNISKDGKTTKGIFNKMAWNKAGKQKAESGQKKENPFSIKSVFRSKGEPKLKPTPQPAPKKKTRKRKPKSPILPKQGPETLKEYKLRMRIEKAQRESGFTDEDIPF